MSGRLGSKQGFWSGSLAWALLALGGCCLSTGGTTSNASTGNVSSTGAASSTGAGSSTGTSGEPQDSSTGASASATASGGTTTGGTTTGGTSTGTSTGFGFRPAVPYKVGESPFAIAVADYDADHALDLAVANHGDGTVSLLWGKGDGTFQAGDPLQTGGASYWLTTADLDGNGTPDLVVANSDLNDVQVFLNDAGGFGFPADYFAGFGPNCVTAADFNGDGLIDLAVSDYGGTSATVLWGADGGGFVAGPTLPGFDGPIFVAVLPDGSLAVVDQHANQVRIYDWDGGFDGPTIADAGSWPTALAIGDLNHDGIPDLAASDYNGGVSVMLGSADGGYEAPKTRAAGGNPNSVVMADFNLDGNLDLAVANSEVFGDAPGTISVFFGRGDGTFGPQMTLKVGVGPVDIAVGDFNRDGYPDLAVANSGDGTISILLTTH